jgi:hypothetical protein
MRTNDRWKSIAEQNARMIRCYNPLQHLLTLAFFTRFYKQMSDGIELSFQIPKCFVQIKQFMENNGLSTV